jgi:hypothetical protein
MDILDLLNQRRSQLMARIVSIENYVQREGEVISKRDFTLKDIPVIKRKIGECEAAIQAIEKFRREARNKK